MAAVLAAALLTGLLVYAVLATPEPNRIAEGAAASTALQEPATPTASARPTTAVPGVAARPATLPEVRPVAAPVRVSIPSIDAELPIVPTGVTAQGAMELPDDPRVAGWYKHGPDPTSTAGAMVLAAHIDSPDRVGPLERLGQVAPGDDVIVSTEEEEIRYVIERVDGYPKTVIDLDAVFARDDVPRLHIVSCGGPWDPEVGSYEDNIVAVAVRADSLS